MIALSYHQPARGKKGCARGAPISRDRAGHQCGRMLTAGVHGTDPLKRAATVRPRRPGVLEAER